MDEIGWRCWEGIVKRPGEVVIREGGRTITGCPDVGWPPKENRASPPDAGAEWEPPPPKSIPKMPPNPSPSECGPTPIPTACPATAV